MSYGCFSGLEACWIVAPDDAHNDKYSKLQMQITVTELDTEYTTDCTKDYVLMRDGNALYYLVLVYINLTG